MSTASRESDLIAEEVDGKKITIPAKLMREELNKVLNDVVSELSESGIVLPEGPPPKSALPTPVEHRLIDTSTWVTLNPILHLPIDGDSPLGYSDRTHYRRGAGIIKILMTPVHLSVSSLNEATACETLRGELEGLQIFCTAKRITMQSLAVPPSIAQVDDKILAVCSVYLCEPSESSLDVSVTPERLSELGYTSKFIFTNAAIALFHAQRNPPMV